MMHEIQKLMDGYVSWLRDKTILREVGDAVEITAPLLDRHNDYLQIYVQRENGHYVLTDDGYTLDDLEQSGCNLDKPKRQELLKMTLNGFGVSKNNSALQIHATEEDFSLKKHSLLQAMLGVNDLFYLAAPHTKSLFYEDVVDWLNLSNIRYVEKVKFTGKSGFDYMFDFVIPPSGAIPERVVKSINRPDKNAAMQLAFEWLDTKETRKPETRAYAFLNDLDQPVKSDVLDAMLRYEVKPIRWSQRESAREELAA